jgi:hypothetical protein
MRTPLCLFARFIILKETAYNVRKGITIILVKIHANETIVKGLINSQNVLNARRDIS